MGLSCYDYALGYASRWQKTRADLGKQLVKKEYEEPEITDVLGRLEEIGLLDDRRYAEQYLFSEGVRKGKALVVIQQKLWQKGVEKDIVGELVEEMEAQLQEGQKKKLEKERMRYTKKDDTMKFMKKMQARGYDYRLVQEVVDDSSHE